MATRTINHPGVEIREIDRSQFAPAIVGTTFLQMGYCDKGEEFTPTELISIQEYETMYGQPSNEAERYAYYAANDILRNGGSLIFSKLPYNNKISNNYKYVGINVDNASTITITDASDLREISGYYTQKSIVSAAPVDMIATSAYDVIAAGGDFGVDQSGYDFIIVNENKARIAGSTHRDGIFFAIVDPVDAMKVQRMFPNPSDNDVMSLIEGISYPTGILYTDFLNPLTGKFSGSSTSEDIMRQFPTIEFLENGSSVDKSYGQQLGVIVCNTNADPNNQGLLQVGILESWVGSIHKAAKNPSTGQSIYLGNIINNQSNYIKWYANLNNEALLPNIKDDTIVLWKADSSYDLIGFTDAECEKKIIGNTIANNMKVIFEKVSNIDEYQIDVVVDAGLSTISQFCLDNDVPASGVLYDPLTSQQGEINAADDVDYWRNVCSEFIAFCQDVRKDCMCVLDVPRNLVVEGNEKYIRKTAPENTFSSKIGNKLRFVTGLNSSYAALYSDWMKAVDDFSGITFWMPPTVKVAGIYATNDRIGNIWDAPAGLNRGIIDGIVDIAFNPNGKAADQVYIKAINYAKQYPLDGFILEGQKTTQVKPSAFDRVNVRRLFLRLERVVYQVARYFVYEPNNSFTRRRLVDVITPIFQATKAAGGLYDYMIVCDETNNTAEVIDHNEMKVAILLKPTRTAEFILVDFVATRTDANFQEILQQVI